MRKRDRGPWIPRKHRDQHPLISRRNFLGGMMGLGTVSALALRLAYGREERLSMHEADFYRLHDLAG